MEHGAWGMEHRAWSGVGFSSPPGGVSFASRSFSEGLGWVI